MKKILLVNGKVVLTIDMMASDVMVGGEEGDFTPIANYLVSMIKSNVDWDGVYERCDYEFITVYDTAFTEEIYNNIDARLKEIVQEFDEFTEADEIVRIGDWGYVPVNTYEEACGSAEFAARYVWISNNLHKGNTVQEVIDVCNSQKPDDLEMNDDDYVVYYTTGSDESEEGEE